MTIFARFLENFPIERFGGRQIQLVGKNGGPEC